MTNAEAIKILTDLINGIPQARGNGKSLTQMMIFEALAMGIEALDEREKIVRGGSNI